MACSSSATRSARSTSRGARLTIASDDVNAHQAGIAEIIAAEGLGSLALFSLGDVYEDADADTRLIDHYAPGLDALQARAEQHRRHQAAFAAVRREGADDQAWEVIRRREAWGALVAEAFPEAIRLSVHPQFDVSEQIGVHLTP